MPLLTTFDPVGACIYCGATENLTDEHIIPFGLGGTLILPDASCKACATITGRFEGICQRTILGNLRVKAGLPTRRKKQRPKALPFSVTMEPTAAPERANIRTVNLPVSEYPAIMSLFTLSTPRILFGLPDFEKETFDTKIWTNAKAVPEALAIARKHGGKGFMSTGFNTKAFCQMLAKIGYSGAVATCGLGAFKPLVLDVISGVRNEVGHLVGGTLDDPPPPGTDLHSWGVEVSNVFGRFLMTAHIRLFATYGAPVYRVVVGELSPTSPLVRELPAAATAIAASS